MIRTSIEEVYAWICQQPPDRRFPYSGSWPKNESFMVEYAREVLGYNKPVFIFTDTIGKITGVISDRHKLATWEHGPLNSALSVLHRQQAGSVTAAIIRAELENRMANP